MMLLAKVVFHLGLGELFEAVAEEFDDDLETCISIIENKFNISSNEMQSIIFTFIKFGLCKISEKDENFIFVCKNDINNILKELNLIDFL